MGLTDLNNSVVGPVLTVFVTRVHFFIAAKLRDGGMAGWRDGGMERKIAAECEIGKVYFGPFCLTTDILIKLIPG